MSPLFYGGMKLDRAAHQLYVEDKAVELSLKEYELLRYFMENPGVVFSSSQIYESIWDEDAIGSDNIVAVHIRHIREKIEVNPKDPRFIKVVWGQGYKLEI